MQWANKDIGIHVALVCGGGDQRYFRHVGLFFEQAPVEELYKSIPFLNGGLFENLDEIPGHDPDVEKEIRVDGFSDIASKQPTVPDFLFFGEERLVPELAALLDEAAAPKARGLLHIFQDYKFTMLIVSDAFCHSKYAQKSQTWFLRHARVLRLDFCAEVKIFDAAVHNLIYFFQKADGTYWQPERRVHRETFGNVTPLPSDDQAKLTYRAFLPEDVAVQTFGCKTLTLEALCYISKGMVVHADERGARGAFELRDLVSDHQDHVHSRPFVEGKHLERWLPAEKKWLEWGTSRAPALFSRPTFPELYTVPEKLISVDMAAGVEKLRVAYDNYQLFHNHSAWSFVPWHALAGVQNNSLKKAARYRGEKPPRPDLPSSSRRA